MKNEIRKLFPRKETGYVFHKKMQWEEGASFWRKALSLLKLLNSVNPTHHHHYSSSSIQTSIKNAFSCFVWLLVIPLVDPTSGIRDDGGDWNALVVILVDSSVLVVVADPDDDDADGSANEQRQPIRTP